MKEENMREPMEQPPVTPVWKRVAALLAAIFVLLLSVAFTWSLATGSMFWI